MKSYNVGDQFQYETKAKGKTITTIITIVAIHPWTKRIMFDNGLILHPCQL